MSDTETVDVRAERFAATLEKIRATAERARPLLDDDDADVDAAAALETLLDFTLPHAAAEFGRTGTT